MEKQSTALNLFLLPLASLVQFLEIDAKKLSILVVLMCIDMLTGTFKAYVAECKTIGDTQKADMGYM